MKKIIDMSVVVKPHPRGGVIFEATGKLLGKFAEVRTVTRTGDTPELAVAKIEECRIESGDIIASIKSSVLGVAK